MTEKNNVPQIRFKGATNQWKEEEVQKYYPKIRNGFVGTATPFYREEGVLYLQGKNIKNGLILKNGYIYVSKEFNEKQIKSQLCENDIIMVQSGHVGECALITEEYKNSNCHALLVLTPNEEVYSRYVVYYFYTSHGKKIIQHIKTGSTIEHILSTDLKTILLKFPSVKEQKKIGEYFQQLDKLIEQKEKKYQKLQQFKKAMLDKMFPANGSNIPSIRFKSFSISWEEELFGQIMDITSVKRIHQLDWTNSGIRFLRARDIVSMYKKEELSDYLYITEDRYNEYSLISGKVKQNDLLVTGVGTIGIPMLITSTDPIYFKDGNIIWFKNSHNLNGNFLYYTFLSKSVQLQIKTFCGIGTVGTYTIESAKATRLKFPKEEEQTKIGNYFQKFDQLIDLQQQELQKLKNLKKAFLAKMFV